MFRPNEEPQYSEIIEVIEVFDECPHTDVIVSQEDSFYSDRFYPDGTYRSHARKCTDCLEEEKKKRDNS